MVEAHIPTDAAKPIKQIKKELRATGLSIRHQVDMISFKQKNKNKPDKAWKQHNFPADFILSIC